MYFDYKIRGQRERKQVRGKKNRCEKKGRAEQKTEEHAVPDNYFNGIVYKTVFVITVHK